MITYLIYPENWQFNFQVFLYKQILTKGARGSEWKLHNNEDLKFT